MNKNHITELDVKDQELLLRKLRSLAGSIGKLETQVQEIPVQPSKPDFREIAQELSAGGSAPLNLSNLLGQAREPQPADATVFATTPTGQSLQQLSDGQFVMVGTTSTGFSLNMVIGGNPNTLFTLVSGLSTGNFMTLDTVQTSTGAKTLQGTWSFLERTAMSSGTAFTPQRALHVVGADGQVAVLPTLLTRDMVVFENNQNSHLAFIKSTATGFQSGIKVFISGGAAARNSLLDLNDIWRFTVNGTEIWQLSTIGIGSQVKYTTYNAVALSSAGNGVPSIVATASVVASTATLAATTVYTTPATPAFSYRLSANIFTVTTGISTGEATLSWTANNGTALITLSSTTINLQSTIGSSSFSLPLRVAGAQNIQLSISRTGTSTAALSAYASVEAM